MNTTAINWTHRTWNPWSGCRAVSTECRHCYAEQLAEQRRGTNAFPRGFEFTLRPHKLTEPRRLKTPSLVFTNSMTDMWFEDVAFAEIDRAFAAIREAPQHRYQILTKRPERAVEYFADREIPSSAWLGVTVGHRSTIHRLDTLRQLRDRALVLFVSAEPLLSSLASADLAGIDWVIGGGESGLHLRDPRVCDQRGLVERVDGRWMPRADRVPWVQQLRDASHEAGAAFWFKQWGGVRPPSAGRTLDGRTYDEMPVHVAGAMPGDAQVRT